MYDFPHNDCQDCFTVSWNIYSKGLPSQGNSINLIKKSLDGFVEHDSWLSFFVQCGLNLYSAQLSEPGMTMGVFSIHKLNSFLQILASIW